MCLTLYKLYRCGCKKPKSADFCLMMSHALELINAQGATEDDPQIQRLEEQCMEKSAARYEVQSGNCDLCNASIAAVGRGLWRAARLKRNLDDEKEFHESVVTRGVSAIVAAAVSPAAASPALDPGCDSACVSDGTVGDTVVCESVGAAQPDTSQAVSESARSFVRDIKAAFASSCIRAGTASPAQDGVDVMGYLDSRHDCEDQPDRETASVAVVNASQMDLDGDSDGESMDYEDDDDMFDGDGITDDVGAWSWAPSPYRQRGDAENEMMMCIKIEPE